MAQSIEHKIVSRIYGKGRGWVFSKKDFARLGSPGSLDLALHRLLKKGTLRRVLRGLYDYPKFSELLAQWLSPDIHQIAQALSRKFGWNIYPSGPTALNLMGLSTQVPGRIVYLSDGPTRSYTVGNTVLTFKNTALKETGFKLIESGLIVQSLKSLGQDGITPQVIGSIREWLKPELRPKILKDTQIATGWVYDAIRRICREEEA
jgi:hypothetical protein